MFYIISTRSFSVFINLTCISFTSSVLHMFSFINLTYMCFTSSVPGYIQFYHPHLHVFYIISTMLSSALSTSLTCVLHHHQHDIFSFINLTCILYHHYHDIFSLIKLTYMCFTSTTPIYLQFYQPYLSVFTLRTQRYL